MPGSGTELRWPWSLSPGGAGHMDGTHLQLTPACACDPPMATSAAANKPNVMLRTNSPMPACGYIWHIPMQGPRHVG